MEAEVRWGYFCPLLATSVCKKICNSYMVKSAYITKRTARPLGVMIDTRLVGCGADGTVEGETSARGHFKVNRCAVWVGGTGRLTGADVAAG